MKNNIIQFWFSTFIITLIAVTRLFPHEANFVPVFAMILFASAHLQNRTQAILLSIGVLWVSDLYLNNWVYYPEGPFIFFAHPFNYLGYIAIALIGSKIFSIEYKNLEYDALGECSIGIF